MPVRNSLQSEKTQPLIRYNEAIETAIKAAGRKQQELTADVARYLAQIEECTMVMKALTEELLLSFHGAFSQKGITPAHELEDDVEQAFLDSAALKRVLGNILANVLKYSAGDLKVVLDQKGIITFANFAPGLDELISQKDRYYTVDTARNSTGLGLSIAKRLTEQIGGNITALYNQECLNIVADFSETMVSSKTPVEMFRFIA